MTDCDVFIHVGYPKAGSTFLQQQVFAQSSAINYLGKAPGLYPDWMIGWHYWDDLHFRTTLPQLRKAVAEMCVDDRPNVVSSEAFTIHGGVGAAQALRIKQVTPQASIVLIVRDPIERLLSYYKRMVEIQGLTMTFDDFLDYKRTPFVFYKRKPAYLPDYLYDELIAYYHDLFEDRVCVLRFEDMVSDPSRFCEALGSFIGVDLDAQAMNEALSHKENPSFDLAEVHSKRFDNAIEAVSGFLPDLKVGQEQRRAFIEKAPEVISSELRRRLEEYLAGKCCGYY